MSAGSAQTVERATVSRGRLQQVIGVIAAEMESRVERRGVAPGDLAALRRGDGGPAFWKLAVRHLEPAGLLPAPGDTERGERERQWIAILQGMALMEALHRPRLRLGQALAARDAAGRPRVAESRILRLLEAEGEPLLVVLRGVVRQLAAAAQPVDWTDVAELVLSEGTSERGRQIRRRVGFDYYRTVDVGTRSPAREEEKEES